LAPASAYERLVRLVGPEVCQHRPMPAPSGRQIHLAYGEQDAWLVEVGAGLRAYTVGGAAVADGYPEREMCAGGRGQVLMPWPNRLGDGHFQWAGQELQTALTEPEEHNAIHGLVRWAGWTVVEQSDRTVRFAYRLYPQPGWPWILDLTISYSLSEAGLEVRGRAENVAGGAGACPFGAGWHPYLAAFGGLVDDLVLTVPAQTTYEVDDRGLPVGRRPVDGSAVDFRPGRRIGDQRLDTAYTDLDRDASGRAVVELAAAEGSSQVTRLWMDAACTHLMVFSGDTLSDVGRRRRGLAVEPMTCAPNMLQSGDGRRLLAEGESFEAAWGVAAG
jgi:aldose 1-epimerase